MKLIFWQDILNALNVWIRNIGYLKQNKHNGIFPEGFSARQSSFQKKGHSVPLFKIVRVIL